MGKAASKSGSLFSVISEIEITDLQLLESTLPEIIFFQWSQQSFLPMFPPTFLNLMFI